MNYSFEYIDIILLAMIAGFIFLRLRGILGKRTGFEGKTAPQFENVLKKVHQESKIKKKEDFDEKAQKEFLQGAKIAYETIITDFSDNDNKLIASKSLLSKQVYDDFNKALKERNDKGYYAEITFIGIKSANIKEHKNKCLAFGDAEPNTKLPYIALVQFMSSFYVGAEMRING